MITQWEVSFAVAVDEPDSDDVVTVARTGADGMLELLAYSGMQPVVTVKKTVTSIDPAFETVETWECDLQDNSVWQP